MRTSLTTRGRALLLAAALLAMGGWLFGVQELYCLSVASLVLVGGGRIWVAFLRWDLSVTRLVHPARVSAGQEARVELAVTNRSPHASPTVEARDPFDGGRRVARFSIAPLRRGETRTSTYRLPSMPRGVYRLGPLELRLTDPLGLVVSAVQLAVETTLTVHPAHDPVPMSGLSSHRDGDRLQPSQLPGTGGNELYLLREYVPGDDLRHVHWPSTARLDDLVIRQPENVRRGRLTVALDLRQTVVADDVLEPLVSAAASLAMSALRSGIQVRVVTTDGWDSGHGSGRGHGPFVLDGLAAARPHKPRPGSVPFRLAGGREPLVVLTTDRATAADVEGVIGMSGARGTTLIVFEGAGAAGAGRGVGTGATGAGAAAAAGAGRGGGRRMVRVAAGGSFPAAWAVYSQMVPAG